MPTRFLRDPRFRDMASKYISVFFLSIVACGALAIWGLTDPDSLAGAARAMTSFGLRSFDWLFLGSCTLFLFICLGLALSRFGDIRLGRDDERPEFATVSWLAMLFAAGMGAGLLFWGAAEPMKHFLEPPPMAPESDAAKARNAMIVTNLHWGLHAWGIYAMGALVLAYFGFRKGFPLLPGSPIRAVFPARFGRAAGHTADFIGVLSVVFGVTGSLAMGIIQIRSGLHSVFGTPLDANYMAVVILLLLTISYLMSAGTSLDKGIQILSNINMFTAVVLMLFLLFFGPTPFLLETFLDSTGGYLGSIIPMSFRLFNYSGQLDWSHTWTLTYFIWWISWTPFVGVFIARISRGRTIREFVTGVILVPTVFSLFWFAVFGGTGLHIELFGGGGFGSAVNQNVSDALFALFDYFPASSLLSLIALFLIFIFLVTSADSASFVLGMLTSDGDEEPPTWRKITWGLLVAGLTAATLFAGGGIHVMRAIAISGAVPFSLIMITQVMCLLHGLFHDTRAVRKPVSLQPAAGDDVTVDANNKEIANA